MSVSSLCTHVIRSILPHYFIIYSKIYDQLMIVTNTILRYYWHLTIIHYTIYWSLRSIVVQWNDCNWVHLINIIIVLLTFHCILTKKLDSIFSKVEYQIYNFVKQHSVRFSKLAVKEFLSFICIMRAHLYTKTFKIKILIITITRNIMW